MKPNPSDEVHVHLNPDSYLPDLDDIYLPLTFRLRN